MSMKNLDRHNRWRNKTVAFRVSPEEDEAANNAYARRQSTGAYESASTRFQEIGAYAVLQLFPDSL